MNLSICIPTFNRAKHLANCLNSIILCNAQSEFEFEVCVSDNCSTDDTEDVVRHAQSAIQIKYQKNPDNLGIPRNFLNVVSMAEGDFVWLIGDDDLLKPNAIAELYSLIDNHPQVDFFYVNTFHLNSDFLDGFPSPFNTANLPSDMAPFSTWHFDGELDFLKLINPKVSFDFLGGMFLSVFRRDQWELNKHVLDENAISDCRTFSHFDNTFPHVKIFAKAFSTSVAYFNSKPLNVCLTGAREWSPMYPFIHSVRLVEALQEYRNNGLPYWKYVYCKNSALNKFVPDFIYILLDKDKSGYAYIKPSKLLLEYCLYPNFYLSIFYFVLKRLRKYFHRLFVRGN
jgi:glycosyltransferase involved in cell wall biosynthesis